jgi:hypothetical protein
MNRRENRANWLDVGILLLGAAVALIHFYLNVLMGKVDLLFTLNGFGYVGLLGLLYLPLPVAQDHRKLVRFVLIAYTLLTIILWVFLGKPYTSLGYFTKLIEAGLVVLLFIKRP